MELTEDEEEIKRLSGLLYTMKQMYDEVLVDKALKVNEILELKQELESIERGFHILNNLNKE